MFALKAQNQSDRLSKTLQNIPNEILAIAPPAQAPPATESGEQIQADDC
ncbi:MAG: hypothetical protein KBH08_03380 [Brachymonas sp.]|nr:hypothetical protein [Brachymonas sp.]